MGEKQNVHVAFFLLQAPTGAAAEYLGRVHPFEPLRSESIGNRSIETRGCGVCRADP